ncbi:hypothetical protein ACOSQ3_025278 [Xanthoceras sorbifolium]
MPCKAVKTVDGVLALLLLRLIDLTVLILWIDLLLFFRHVSDVELAEALTILEGIQLALSRGFLPLCVESDALNVVSLCYLLVSFDIRTVSYVPRSCNEAANGIVKWALLWKNPTQNPPKRGHGRPSPSSITIDL